MKLVDQPYEAYQICYTCEEEGNCFHMENVWFKWEECLKSKKRMAGLVKSKKKNNNDKNNNNANKH